MYGLLPRKLFGLRPSVSRSASAVSRLFCSPEASPAGQQFWLTGGTAARANFMRPYTMAADESVQEGEDGVDPTTKIDNEDIGEIVEKKIMEINKASAIYNNDIAISNNVALAIKEFFRNEEVYTHSEYDASGLSAKSEPLFEPLDVLPAKREMGLDLRDRGFFRVVVDIKRVKVVKTRGKIMSFVALVVVGNRNGVIGFAEGKSTETIMAIQKATRKAFTDVEYFPRYEGHTLYHSAYEQFKRTTIHAYPRSHGHGLVCHEAIFSMCNLLGIKDVSAKITGPTTKKNVVECFFALLRNQKTMGDVARLRGKNYLQMSKSVNIFA